MHPQTKPKKLAPDVEIPVRPPRTGVNTAPGVRGLGVEEVVVLEVRTGVATRTRGAGGGDPFFSDFFLRRIDQAIRVHGQSLESAKAFLI